MQLDRLWAPWRMEYIRQAQEPVEEECFICAALRCVGTDAQRERLLVWRGETACAILNRYPYNNGHLLIAPHSHKAELGELEDNELLGVQKAIRYFINILRKTMQPDGFNVGLNLGRSAGAGLPGHVHWHVVPRWNGDTNFMPILGDTKVIVQALEAAYDVLRTEIEQQPFRE